MTGKPETAPSSSSQTLLETFHGTFMGGRYLLTGLTTLLAAAYFSRPVRAGVSLQATHIFVLAALLAYQGVVLALVQYRKLARLPTPAILVLDLLSVFLLITYGAPSLAGGASLSLLSLVIIAGSLFYGLRGGVIAAVGAIAVEAMLSLPNGEAAEMRALRDIAPYFLLTGGFTGFLVNRLETAFARYQDALIIEQNRKVESEVLLNEMELARRMQQAALPAHPPRITGLDVAAISFPAREVGGDFHLYLRPDDGHLDRLGLVVGDVTGKGIPAALAATSVAHLLPWLHPLADTSAALEDLNSDVGDRLPVEAFVTLVLADVDVHASQIKLWTAGHPPALCWDARRGRVIEATVYNPYLGLLPSWQGNVEVMRFYAGDVIVLYSDGLSEMRDVNGEQFGTSRAAAALEANAARSADEIAAALVAAATAWGTTSDDLTLIVCKRTAQPDTERRSADVNLPYDSAL